MSFMFPVSKNNMNTYDSIEVYPSWGTKGEGVEF